MNAVAASTGQIVHVIALRAGQCFSLPVTTVWEVLSLPELEPVPLAPSEMLGSFQLRGEIVPVMLPDTVLAIGSTEVAPSVLALLRDGEATVALAFDRVLGVVSIDPATLVPHPQAQRRPWMAHLRVDSRFQLTTVLDGPALIAALVEQLQFNLSTT
jgi:purine-binding chemotaxis protein CheW